MENKHYFKIGDEVSANDLFGRKIIGIYRGLHNNYGVWVYGFIWGQDPILKDHHCSRLTLQARGEKKSKPKNTNISSFQPGDPCKGLTKDNKEIIGVYQGPAAKPYAWIRGIVAKNGLISPFEAKQTYKVTRESLKKQA